MDKTEVVQKMQEYISEHINDEDFNLDGVYEAVGYSRRHGDRVFKELVGRTPQSYVKSICLTEGAGRLLETGNMFWRLRWTAVFSLMKDLPEPLRAAFRYHLQNTGRGQLPFLCLFHIL